MKTPNEAKRTKVLRRMLQELFTQRVCDAMLLAGMAKRVDAGRVEMNGDDAAVMSSTVALELLDKMGRDAAAEAEIMRLEIPFIPHDGGDERVMRVGEIINAVGGVKEAQRFKDDAAAVGVEAAMAASLRGMEMN